MGKVSERALDALYLLMLPLALAACALLQLQASALLTLAVAIGAVTLFFIGWERSKPGLRQILPAAVLVAAAVVGRIVFAAAPNVQPVTAICIIGGAVFGKRTGFMTGSMAGLMSSFFLGLGAWTPWQMYAWGLIGYIAGLAFCGKRERGSDPMAHLSPGKPSEGNAPVLPVLLFGFIASFVFGLIMNTWTLIGFTGPVNWGSAAVVYGSGFVFDVAHAVSTVAFLALLYVPLRKKLGRIALKYDLMDVRSAKAQA